MHLLTIFTAITLTSTVAFAGTIQRRSFDTGVAGSHVNTQANKGLNNGQANGNKGIVKGSYTVVQASQSCGNSQLNCCSNVEQGDDSSTGVVAATLGIAGKVFVDCSPVSLLLAASSIDDVCTSHAVCCNGPGETTQFGVVNANCNPIDVNVL